MHNNKIKEQQRGKIDWMITVVPFIIIIFLCLLFFFMPEQSNKVIGQIRYLLGDTYGVYYLIIGLGVFLVSIYIACSKYGNIVLGSQNEKPKYSFFTWGSMMFTAGLAADILFYSFSEWVLYATDPHIAEMGSMQDWASVYPIFHWSLIPWGFLSCSGRGFWFYAPCKKKKTSKIFGGLQTCFGKIYGTSSRENYRFTGRFCAAGRYCHNI